MAAESITQYLKKITETHDNTSGKLNEDYTQFGFLFNPFLKSESPLLSSFDELFVNRREEVKEIMDNLRTSIISSGADIALIGATGTGTRTIVNLIKNFLKSEKREGKENSLYRKKLHKITERDLNEFGPEVREEIKEEIREGLEKGKISIITTPFNDKKIPLLGKNKFNEVTFGTIRKIISIDDDFLDQVTYLSPWTANTWKWVKKEELRIIKDYEVTLVIDKLEDQDIIEMITKRVDHFKIKGKTPKINIFSIDVKKEIAECSGGFPRFALEAAYHIVENCAENNSSIKPTEVKTLLKKHKLIYSTIKNKFEKIIPRCDLLSEIENISDDKLNKLKLYLNMKSDAETFKKNPTLSMQIRKLKHNFQVSIDLIKFMDHDEELFKKFNYKIVELKNKKKKGEIYRRILEIFIALTGKNVTSTQICEYYKKYYGKISLQTISKKLKEMKNEKIIKGGNLTIDQDKRTNIYSISDFAKCVFENEYIMPEIKREQEY
jgi:hypothetical protein